MNKEDYSKYYIQGSDHYLIPKYEFIELFNEMENWREEAKELKEKINNIKKIIIDNSYNELYEWFNELREERVIEIVNILDIKKDIEKKRGGINE